MVKSTNVDSKATPLDELRLWQRCHIHLTIYYGFAILLAMLFLGYKVYELRVNSELSALQKRLVVLVTALADSVEVQAIAATPLDSRASSASHQAMQERFAKVMNEDALLKSIYVLRQTNEPTQLRFYVDTVRNGEQAAPGDAYDASGLLTLLQGFSMPVVEDHPYRDSFGVSLSGYAPIRDDQGRSVGMLGADIDAKDIDLAKKEVLTSTLTFFGITVFALGFLSTLVAQNIRNPLNKIIDATAKISDGKFSTRVELKRNDEFGIMGSQIDQMAAQLQQREFIRQTFGRYVSEVVAESLLQDASETTLGGEERIVSILFSDLKGYTSLSEHMPPTQLVKMLNEYFGEMTEIIDTFGGCVIEFMGDGILAVFGAPQSAEDHAEKAVRCALAMQSRVKSLPEKWKGDSFGSYISQDEYETFGMRIGIHTGQVVAGNLGCPSRMKYAVIGDSVNIAARLEEMNKSLNTDILVSEDTYHQLPVSLSEELHPVGVQKITGRERPLSLFTPNIDENPGQSSALS